MTFTETLRDFTAPAIPANPHSGTINHAPAFPNKSVATKPSPAAPRWETLRESMTQLFPSPHHDETDTFRQQVDAALQALEAKKPAAKTSSPIFLGERAAFTPTDSHAGMHLPAEGNSLECVMARLLTLFDGLNNPANPSFQYNIICHPNKAALIASLLGNYISPNFISGHSAWNLTTAEMQCAAIVSNLVDGWDSTKSGGVFTYGGAACYLYGIKHALKCVYEAFDFKAKGITPGGKVLCSRNAHFANEISCDWLGIGTDHLHVVDTVPGSNEMCMSHLESLLQEFQRQGSPVITVICTMGTTDEMAIDPVEEVAALLQAYPNPEGFGRAHIYCDSVAGWAFLPFKGYDFEQNELEFSPAVRDRLAQVFEKISKIRYADSFSLDFHKTGWSSYTTSMFMVNDMARFERVMSRAAGHIVHSRTHYNPGLCTLEVSRSCAPALAAWSTLLHFGARGFRTMMGGVVEMGYYLRGLLEHERDIVCCNEQSCGLMTALRIYPEGTDAESLYKKELADGSEGMRAQLARSNELQKRIADRIWDLSRSGQKIDGEFVTLVNFSGCLARTDYFHDGLPEGEGVIFALKAFPFNVNITRRHMDQVLVSIKSVRDEIVVEMSAEASVAPNGK